MDDLVGYACGMERLCQSLMIMAEAKMVIPVPVLRGLEINIIFTHKLDTHLAKLDERWVGEHRKHCPYSV